MDRKKKGKTIKHVQEHKKKDRQHRENKAKDAEVFEITISS